MSHCKDCEFFANSFEVDKLTGTDRKVQKVLDDSDTGYCFNAFIASDFVDDWLKRDQSKERLKAGVYASCDEYRGELTVGKNFGCIHFEQRTIQKDDMESTPAKRQLLIGCGRDLRRRIFTTEGDTVFTNLTTLDINPDHKPDVVFDLNDPVQAFPFEDNTFDEIHGYEVLEHLGRQGDYIAFFRLFETLWRALKPDGLLCFTCPKQDSVWAWGDPSHTRIVTPEQMTFLSQQEYINQVGKTPMSDFRSVYFGDFDTVHVGDYGQHSWACVLKAVKPRRGM